MLTEGIHQESGLVAAGSNTVPDWAIPGVALSTSPVWYQRVPSRSPAIEPAPALLTAMLCPVQIRLLRTTAFIRRSSTASSGRPSLPWCGTERGVNVVGTGMSTFEEIEGVPPGPRSGAASGR